MHINSTRTRTMRDADSEISGPNPKLITVGMNFQQLHGEHNSRGRYRKKMFLRPRIAYVPSVCR